jgi:GDP-L-fucose synthase
MSIKKGDVIFVAGHNGMVGSAILRLLKKKNFKKIITVNKSSLDLTDQKEVYNFFKKKKINIIFLCAAKVGGIYANNTYPGEFIYKNIMIQSNIINAAFKNKINKILFLGSSCVYPVITTRKIKEEDLLTGKLEMTNEPYSIAKISGIKMCESYNRQYNTDYRSLMPTNLFGPGDNFHPENSHVIAGLIRKFILAKKNNHKQVVAWGTGKPKREFLYVDDLADAAFYIANLNKKKYLKITHPRISHINIGYGKDYSIKSITKIMADALKYKGKIIFDKSKNDGVKKKLLDSKKIFSLGWKPRFEFKKTLRKYIQDLYKLEKPF